LIKDSNIDYHQKSDRKGKISKITVGSEFSTPRRIEANSHNKTKPRVF